MSTLPLAAPRPGLLRLTLILGALSAVSPLAVDMYLPAFDAIGRDLGVGMGRVQLTFSVYAVATAIGPLIYGPLSDRFGRKVPVLLGMAAFVVSSLLCACVGSFAMLLLLRALQGATSAVGVLAQAIVRDVTRGYEAVKLMSLMMLMHSVSPLLAPAIGTAVIEAGSWRWIFVILAAPGLVAATLVVFGLSETLPHARRHAGSVRDTLATYALILRSRDFLVPCLLGSAALAVLLVYVASSSFLLIDLLGFSRISYSVIFAGGAVLMIGAAQAGAPLARRFGVVRMARSAAIAMAGAGSLVGALAWTASPNLALLLAGIWTMLACVGLLLPTATVLALEPFEGRAGAAASMSNALRTLIAAAATVITGLAYNGTDRPALLTLAGCGLMGLGCACALRSTRGSREPDGKLAQDGAQVP